MTGPFTADTDGLHAHADTLRTAADEAARGLEGARTDAAGAATGFPGDAAAPFVEMLRAVESDDRALADSVRAAAEKVGADAGTYDAQDAANADLYRGGR